MFCVFSCSGCPVQKPVLRSKDLHIICVLAVHFRLMYLFEHVIDCEKCKKNKNIETGDFLCYCFETTGINSDMS